MFKKIPEQEIKELPRKLSDIKNNLLGQKQLRVKNYYAS